jgi:hypothetical protein
VDHELVLADGAPEIALQAQAFEYPVVHGRVEDLVATLPLLLGLVHGEVGVSQHLLCPDFFGGAQGDADAGREEYLVSHNGERRPQFLDDPLRDPGGILYAPHLLEQDGELVPAKASRGVPGTQILFQAGADRLEQLVTHLVPEAVVDVLEVVQVHEEHRHGARLATAALGEGLFEAVEEQGPVGQTG